MIMNSTNQEIGQLVTPTRSTTTTTSTSTVTPRTTRQAPTTETRYRLRGKQFFLTYPQCSVTKESTLTKIKETFKENLRFAVVSEEDHQDGTPHLHVALNLHKEIDWRTCTKMDALTGQHGNYQTSRSMIAVVKYVVKGNVVVSHGINLERYLQAAKMGKSTQIAVTLDDGATLTDIKEIDAGFLMMNMKKIKEYQTWLRTEKMKKQLVQPGEFDYASRSLAHGSAVIAGWLQENLFSDRDFKQKQLFIWGDPNMGKTTLINSLREIGVRIYYMPYEDFYDMYDDDCYDLIVLDEFKGQKRIQDLNLWLDGSHFPVRRKGIAPYLKKANLPMIIISNYRLELCYKVDETRLAPLQARLKQVEVKRFIEIDCVRNETE